MTRLSYSHLVFPLLLSATVFSGCSGYQSSLATNGAAGNGSLGGGENAVTPETPAQAWGKLEVAGEVSGGRYDKTSVFRIDKEKKELILSLPMTANAYVDGTQLTLPLSKLPGASLQLDPIEGGSALTLHVPLASLVKGVDFADPLKLPNGRPLPFVPEGELPAEALSLTNLTTMSATIYLGKNVVGIYVTLPLNPILELENQIKRADGSKVWGSLHTYPASCLKCKDGGLFTAVQIPADLARLIEDNL